MSKYIALLRGINVSGQKKILMKDLKQLFLELSFENVETYIQSGNVVFSTAAASVHKIEDSIKKAIKERFGHEVEIVVRTHKQLLAILEKNPYKDPELLASNKVYYVLLKQTPEAHQLALFKTQTYENEVCTIIDNCGYLVCYNGAGRAKLNNNLIEKKLKVTATSRNHRTMLKLLALSE